MKAVVLAAGEGTRLRPFTNSRPKVMIPVANKPILQYVIEALIGSGIKDIVLVVGYKKERIMSYFGDGKRFGARISYVFQERQLGTAHALLAAAQQLDSRFLVVAGDNLIDAKTISDLLSKSVGKDDEAGVVVTVSESPSKYGVVVLDKERVIKIVEKPQKKIGNVISTGIYCFTPHILKVFEKEVARGEGAITNALQAHLEEIYLRAVHTEGRWMDAVYPWDLLKLNSFALDLEGQEVKGTVEGGVTMKGAVSIGAGSRVRSGCYIEGPVIIGEGCDIGPNAVIMPSTSIGNGVSIGPFSFVQESLISDNVIVSTHSHLSHCVIDDGASLGPGFQAPAAAASTQVEQEHFHLRRIGCLMGERTVVGAGVVVTPGRIVGADCHIGDLVVVRSNLKDRSIVV